MKSTQVNTMSNLFAIIPLEQNLASQISQISQNDMDVSSMKTSQNKT